MQSFKLTAASLIAVLALAPVALADVITLNPNTADAGVETSGGTAAEVYKVGDYGVSVGEYFSPGYSAYIMPFELPTLAPGEVIIAADLRIQMLGKNGVPDFNGDLYGLGVRSTPDVLVSDFYNGPLDGANVLIQDNYLNDTSPVRTDGTTGPFVNTDASGDAALVAYINSLYVGGATGGQFVFLRISPDATGPQGFETYEVLTQNAGGANEKPLLTLETGVPEPGSLALLALGGLLIARRRRD